jgi:ubiquinone/menaquinone biosynthesis C-methylase UbiE
MADEGNETKAHLFNNNSQADAYKKYRPRYPKELFDAIYDYAGSTAATDTALDIATGSGQAATELANRYSRVIAQDASEAQLAEADKLNPRVQYQRASAEATGLPDASVDMVTVAQALHWFDLPKFYAEAHRVLRPGGTLAAWGYDLCRLNDEDADPVLRKLYGDTLGPYWDERRPHREPL